MGETMTQVSGEFEQLYQALRVEVDELAGGQPGESGQLVKYPDPAQLQPIQRRVLVKSIFAFIEASLYGLKQTALELSSSSDLTQGELASVREESYEVSDSGEVKVRPAKIRFLSNVRFSLVVVARMNSIDYAPDWSVQGWQDLAAAAKVRDRLMHPKHITDLTVTDDEIRSALAGMIWLDHQIVLILARTVKRLQQVVANLEQEIAENRAKALSAQKQVPEPT